MTRRMDVLWVIALAITLCLVLPARPAAAQTPEEPDSSALTERLEKIERQLTTEEYQLRYRFQPGEVLRYRVQQLVTVETSISGTHQKTQLRSVSTKRLEVETVDQNQNIRFVHSIEDVDLWSEVTGRQPVHYNSRQHDTVPPEYEQVAKSIGVPVSLVTIDPVGNIVQREDKVTNVDLGNGGFTVPLPEGAVAVGHEWSEPLDLRVRLRDGRQQVVKTRRLYRLESVSAGLATLSVSTQVLTPVSDPRVKSQLIQRLSHGTIRFDLDRGRILSRQLDWDETVVAFNGPESNMQYLARLTEQQIDEQDAVTANP